MYSPGPVACFSDEDDVSGNQNNCYTCFVNESNNFKIETPFPVLNVQIWKRNLSIAITCCLVTLETFMYMKSTHYQFRELFQLCLAFKLIYIYYYNYITSVFHWNVTIWLAMKWSHDYKRDVLHPNKTRTWTCTCLHDEIRGKQSTA